MSNDRFPVDSSKNLNKRDKKIKKKERCLRISNLFLFFFLFVSAAHEDSSFLLWGDRDGWTHCVITSRLNTTRSRIKRKLYTETVYK